MSRGGIRTRHLFTGKGWGAHFGPVATGDKPELPRQLRDAIKAAGVSVRGLARTLAGEDEQQAEDERRALNRYLAGKHRPTRANADRIAAALGLPAGTFRSSEDDDPPLTIPERITELAALVEEVRSLVEERLPEPDEEGEQPLASRRVAILRLRSLEEKVDGMAQATAESLAALAAAIDEISVRLHGEEPGSPGQKRARPRR